MNSDIQAIEAALGRLDSAILANRSRQYCLALWSEFIRLRDGQRCVLCHDDERLSAHHIVRKSFMSEAQFQTGNGISLCRACHKEPHEAFNRQPDLQLPMDAQGGEQIELLMALYKALLTDAQSRNILRDDFYNFSDELLQKFKLFQSIDPMLPFSGKRLEQAYLIWRQTPRGTMQALLSANGFSLPPDFIQQGEMTVFFSE